MHEPAQQSQITYYRRRAAEYDATAYGDLAAADARIAGLVEQLRPAGDVLEIAPGTGIWTEKLARLARTVTAVDAAPEMIEIAKQRVFGQAVEFVVADVFEWIPPRRFDTVFFSAWLSHVPDASFATFWSLLRDWLGAGGRVVFVDEQPGEAGKEAFLPGSSELVQRQLADGSRYRIVKVFRSPLELERALGRLGWRVSVRPAGSDWLVGEAWPS